MVLLAIAHFILAFFAEVCLKWLEDINWFEFIGFQSFVVDFLIFKKFRKWFPSLAPSESLYKKIDNETKHSTRWLPNPLAAYRTSKETRHRNGSTVSSPLNQTTNELNGKGSPPESGVWTQSQTSANSLVIRDNDVLHTENHQKSPIIWCNHYIELVLGLSKWFFGH